MQRRVLAMVCWLLLMPFAASAADPALETVDSGEAPAMVRASRGLVFVDLYADW